MSDATRRLKERAAAQGDPLAAASVQADMARTGRGVSGFLEALVGKNIFVEGIRINLRGRLIEVLYHGDGAPAGLVLSPCQRVSYFERAGPQANYTYTHTRPRMIPYEIVHDIGEEGFAEGKWDEVKAR